MYPFPFSPYDSKVRIPVYGSDSAFSTFQLVSSVDLGVFSVIFVTLLQVTLPKL